MRSNLKGTPLVCHRISVSAYLCVGCFGTALFVACEAKANDRIPDNEVVQLLRVHCLRCHGYEKREADVNFSFIAEGRVASRHRKLWRKAIAQLEVGTMPPKDEPQLTLEQRDRLLGWMKQSVDTIDCTDPNNRDPGPPLLRRLSLAEYSRTVPDLMGFECDAATAVGMIEEAGEGNPYGNLAAALDVSPTLMDKYFSAADLILDRFFGTELSSSVDGRIQDQARNSREQMFGLKPGEWRKADFEVSPPKDISPRDAASAIASSFIRRAYRGQAERTDVDRLLSIFDRSAAQGKNYGDSIRWMLKAVLVSPKFLYRLEPNRTIGEEDPAAAYRVSDQELAVRLSYFLWSSMPDDELFDLAERKRLSAELDQQIGRMLADPRARAITDNFATRWLQISRLPTARPSTEFFPEFNANVRQAMFDETWTYFDRLRQENRSLLELLDANYTYANEELARYYGLPDVQGKEFRRIELSPESHRGGLLGMGSILSLTSHTSRTSPTLRGKWILDVIFGSPPPPPPANVSQIKEDAQAGREVHTFREKLAQHANSEACAACHRKMDPLGFALDNYNAVGRWREKAGDQPLDVTGELPTGEKLNGSTDLKRIVMARRDEFVRNLTEQMLIYALGRELDDYDDCAVREITDQLGANDYRFSALIKGIVNSFPFQYRRNDQSQ